MLVDEHAPIDAFAKVGKENRVKLIQVHCIAVITEEHLIENAADSSEPWLRLDTAEVEDIVLALPQGCVVHESLDIRRVTTASVIP